MTDSVADPLPAYIDLGDVGAPAAAGRRRREPVPPAAPGPSAPDPSAPDSSAPARSVSEPPPLARNFGALFGGQLVTWTMTLLWTLIVPRLLGPSGFGIINTALSVSGVLFIFLGLGTRNYLVREMVIDPDDAPKLVGTAIVLRLILSPLVAVGAIAFAWIAHYNHVQAVALYLAAAMNIANLMDDPAAASFQAIERMKYLAFGDIINKTSQSLIGIAIAVAGLGAVGITANMALIGVVVVVLHFIWLRRYVRVDLRTSRRRLVSMARHSVSFWAMGLFFTFYLWIDTVLLSLMTSSKVVGWYGAATTLVTTLMFLPNLLATTWLPRLVAAFKLGERKLFSAARTPLELAVVLSVPLTAGTAMAAGTIVHVLYGPEYAPAAHVMAVLAFCIPPTYVNIITTQVLIASGRQRIASLLMLGAAVVNPLLNLFLIPLTESRYHNGAIGAAAALDVTELLMAVGAFAIVSRHVFDRNVVRRFVPIIGASAAMWAVTAAAAPLGSGIALAGGVLTLLVLTVVWRIPSDQEIAFLRLATARVRGRQRAVDRC